MSELAMIVGAGPGLSASLARLCASEGMGVVLAARNVAKLSALAEETGASTCACDASRREDVDALFDTVLDAEGVPDLVVFNASARVRGAVAKTYLHVHRQHRSAWTWEVELRPWVERF